jgi:hypothetical protein
VEVVNVLDKLSLFQEHWKPKIIAQLNDYDIRVVKVSGEFVWHKHDDTDDFFFVLKVGSRSRCVTAMLSWGLESCSSFRRASNTTRAATKRFTSSSSSPRVPRTPVMLGVSAQ